MRALLSLENLSRMFHVMTYLTTNGLQPEPQIFLVKLSSAIILYIVFTRISPKFYKDFPPQTLNFLVSLNSVKLDLSPRYC